MHFRNCIFAVCVGVEGLLFSSCKVLKHKENIVPVGSLSFPSKIIEMKTSACFGRCPVYEIGIDEAGNCFYSGLAHVVKLGKYKRQISKDELQQLIRSFDENQFWSMKDEYVANVADLPTISICCVKDGKNKCIKDLIGAPKSLKVLEKLIESVAFTGDWQSAD